MKLKSSLLYLILENSQSVTRYSRAYLNLKNVIKLEEKEKHIFDKKIINSFNELTNKFNQFYNKVPLIIIERYYNDHKDKINKYCHLNYKETELTDVQIMDLFVLLEDFFNECFALACLIANLYNLEIKINNNVEGAEENYL